MKPRVECKKLSALNCNSHKYLPAPPPSFLAASAKREIRPVKPASICKIITNLTLKPERSSSHEEGISNFLWEAIPRDLAYTSADGVCTPSQEYCLKNAWKLTGQNTREAVGPGCAFQVMSLGPHSEFFDSSIHMMAVRG